MQRSFQTELMEVDGLPEEQVARVHRDLTRIHRMLGDTRTIVAALRRDPLPVRRVLDVGCGQGGVLRDIRSRLRVDTIGVDLKPPVELNVPFSIIRADAVSDGLPAADVAFSMYLGHHLSERQLVKLIRNVGRSCRRFLLLDLVRHPLPLAMFRLFVAPFIFPITATDGQISIRRSYTPAELVGIAREALAGTDARFRHSMTPLYTRQLLDISYAA
jgi:SAM-dependent methyltransferase